MHFAILLSGCGVYDGSEVGEVILSLLAIEEQGATWDAFAPNRPSNQHIDHITNDHLQGDLSIMEQSARLVRGNIQDIASFDSKHYDAVVVPGGFGAVHNLCDFATKDLSYNLFPDVETFLKSAIAKHLPMCFVCIAPMLIPKLFQQAVFTIGNDSVLAKKITTLGCRHQNCEADSYVVDKKNRIISTPANMLAKNFVELKSGIFGAVKAACELSESKDA